MNYETPEMREARRRESADASSLVDARFVARLVRRRAGLLLLVLFVGVAGAAIYLHGQPPTYVSSAKVLIEAQRGGGDSPYPESGPAVDSAQVESQVEILRASIIAEVVVRKLDLVSDPEFVPPRRSRGIFSSLLARAADDLSRLPAARDYLPLDAWAAPDETPQPTGEEVFNTAVASFADRIWVRRLGQSNVIEIDFSANSPDKATRIAAETVDAYLSGAWREAISPNAFRRFNDDVMRKSLAVSNARVISTPLPPLGKSSPKTTLVLLFAAAASLFVGLSLAVWLEARRPAERRRGSREEPDSNDVAPLRERARVDRGRYSLTDAGP